MFQIPKTETFRTPVTVHYMTEAGGRATGQFTAVFRRLPISELDSQTRPGDKTFLGQVLVGWEGIQDENGQDMAFSSAALAQLTEIPEFTSATVAAYFTAINGSRRGN